MSIEHPTQVAAFETSISEGKVMIYLSPTMKGVLELAVLVISYVEIPPFIRAEGVGVI